MGSPPVPRSDAIAPTLTKFNLTRRRYTDADIVALERADVTDPMIVAALREAYRQQDSDGADIEGFRRGPSEGTFGDAHELDAMLEDVEHALEATPKDFATRARGLSILRNIACLRKYAARESAR